MALYLIRTTKLQCSLDTILNVVDYVDSGLKHCPSASSLIEYAISKRRTSSEMASKWRAFQYRTQIWNDEYFKQHKKSKIGKFKVFQESEIRH